MQYGGGHRAVKPKLSSSISWSGGAKKFFDNAIRKVDDSYELIGYEKENYSASVNAFIYSASMQKTSQNAVNIFGTFRGYIARVTPTSKEYADKYETLVYGVGIRALGSSIMQKSEFQASGKISGFARAAASREFFRAETSRLVEVIGLKKFSQTNNTGDMDVNGALDGKFVYQFLPSLLKEVQDYIDKYKSDDSVDDYFNPQVMQFYPKSVDADLADSSIYALVLIKHGYSLNAAKNKFKESADNRPAALKLTLDEKVLIDLYKLLNIKDDHSPGKNVRGSAARILEYSSWPWVDTIHFFPKP